MLSDQCHRRARGGQYLRAKQPEFSVSNYGHSRIYRDLGALENSASRGQRFGEHRPLVRNLVGHRQEVYDWEFQKLCMRAITSDDSEHGPQRAMTWIAGVAQLAAPTPGIDLADH